MKILLIFCLMLGVLLETSAQRSEKVRVVNDHIVRKNSIVKFKLKSAGSKENLYLVDKDKKKYPVQFLKDGYACAIMSLNPGEVKTFKTVS